jgi:hypothetical protein
MAEIMGRQPPGLSAKPSEAAPHFRVLSPIAFPSIVEDNHTSVSSFSGSALVAVNGRSEPAEFHHADPYLQHPSAGLDSFF